MIRINKSRKKISQSLFDSSNRLKQLEQLSWNVDRTGEVGKWDIARATNFQVDPEKHPYLNAALRGVNNTTGFVACIENIATNSAGTILFDLPAAVEDLSVGHGGPSFEELAFSMQGAIPAVPDELVPYAFGRLSQLARRNESFQEIKSFAQIQNVHWESARFRMGELETHFMKHAKDWSDDIEVFNQDAYLKRARNLLHQNIGEEIVGHIRSNGDLVRYNVKTNEFAVGTSEGIIRTLFKPKAGMNYWLREKTK